VSADARLATVTGLVSWCDRPLGRTLDQESPGSSPGGATLVKSRRCFVFPRRRRFHFRPIPESVYVFVYVDRELARHPQLLASCHCRDTDSIGETSQNPQERELGLPAFSGER
jgi:hypothetical protein